MQDLINEIRKLIEYAGENGTIKKEDIDKLSIKKLESVIFDLTDNLGKKDISGALQVLQNLIYAKEPLAKILVTLYNHFKKLYITKLALNTNRDLVTSLNLKPNQTFLTNKYRAQSNFFKENELRAILQNLCDLDYDFKSGKIDLQIGIETILCRYCS
jgi:DNA polymerase-3 subunit delta